MHLSHQLKLYARKLKTPLQINLLKYYGNNITESNIIKQSLFLKEELMIRLSHRVFDLYKLPYGLPIIPEIKDVIDLYCDSFDKISLINRPSNIDKALYFTDLLEDILDRHTDLEKSIAIGIKKLDSPLIDFSLINNDLDTFFLSRIGVRTLISHQIETVKNNNSLIKKCEINTLVKDAIYELDYISDRLYGQKPTIINDNTDIEVDHIPSYIYYCLYEILKNSTAHQKNDILDVPIKVDIGFGKDDIVVKISDKGGGFPIKNLKNVLTYSYSTTPINDIQKIVFQINLLLQALDLDYLRLSYIVNILVENYLSILSKE